MRKTGECWDALQPPHFLFYSTPFAFPNPGKGRSRGLPPGKGGGGIWHVAPGGLASPGFEAQGALSAAQAVLDPGPDLTHT